MIEGGIKSGKYETTTDTILEDQKSFQSFLYRNLKKKTNGLYVYNEVRPSSHRPASLFTTAKTQKFTNFNKIFTDNLKFKPI